jgi:succinate dehydrogenase hydrophobic anchor subunit
MNLGRCGFVAAVAGAMTDGRNEFYRWLGRKIMAAVVLVCAIFALLFGLFINAWSAGTVFEYLMMAASFLLALTLLGFGGRLWNRAQ